MAVPGSHKLFRVPGSHADSRSADGRVLATQAFEDFAGRQGVTIRRSPEPAGSVPFACPWEEAFPEMSS